MPETTFSCTSSRLARQIALFRLFRIPLMLAVAMLCVCTIRETAACLSSEAETEQIALEESTSADPEAAQSAPAHSVAEDSTAVDAASCRVGLLPNPTVSKTRQDAASTLRSRNYAGRLAKCGKGLVLTANKTTAACKDLAIRLFGKDSAFQIEMDKFTARLPTLAKALGPASTPTPPLAAPKKPEPTAVVIINPQETHGTVLYLLNGKPHALDAGQREELPLGPAVRVEFDRGGDFGKAGFQVTGGTYRFRVTERGWDLVREEHPTSSPAKTAN